MDQNVIHQKKALRYVVAHEQIKEFIQKNHLKKGDKLPSENELSEMLGISRGTVRQALMLLRESGIIYNHQGKGNFLCGTEQTVAGLERAATDMMKFATEPIEERRLVVEYSPSTETVQKALELNETTLLAQAYIQYVSGGQVIAYRLFFIPFERLSEANVALGQEDDLLDFVDDCLQNLAARVSTSFSCVEAREDVAENLMVSSGTRILYFLECMWDKTGQALAYSKLYCHPDYFHFTINRE